MMAIAADHLGRAFPPPMKPALVKQKQRTGFHVYVTAEKDYGTRKTGNAQDLSFVRQSFGNGV